MEIFIDSTRCTSIEQVAAAMPHSTEVLIEPCDRAVYKVWHFFKAVIEGEITNTRVFTHTLAEFQDGLLSPVEFEWYMSQQDTEAYKWLHSAPRADNDGGTLTLE